MSTASPEFPGSPAPAAATGEPAATSSSGKATWSLVCGILSFVFIPLLLAIAAILLGREAKREIASTPGKSGAGLAQAGVVLGWINLVLSVLFIALIIAGAAFG